MFNQNKELKYYVSKNNKDIIIREEYRQDIEYIKILLRNILNNLGLKDLYNNSTLKDYEYIDNKKSINNENDVKIIKNERTFQL
jgi:hypothetical protein